MDTGWPNTGRSVAILRRGTIDSESFVQIGGHMIRTRLLTIVACRGRVLSARRCHAGQALYVRPSKAPLHDASGEKNGCIAEIPPLHCSAKGQIDKSSARSRS